MMPTHLNLPTDSRQWWSKRRNERYQQHTLRVQKREESSWMRGGRCRREEEKKRVHRRELCSWRVIPRSIDWQRQKQYLSSKVARCNLLFSQSAPASFIFNQVRLGPFFSRPCFKERGLAVTEWRGWCDIPYHINITFFSMPASMIAFPCTRSLTFQVDQSSSS